MITPTTAFTKIAKLTAPIRIIQGGSSAGKTYSIIQYLILYALNKKLDISIVAESIPVIKRDTLKIFVSVLTSMGLYDEKNHNKTDRIYTLNESKFEFFGCEDPSKLRGARRDILFINEANNVSFESYLELKQRTRQFTILDYNPSTAFWAHTELVDKEDVDFLIVTYKDNEYIPAENLKDIVGMEEKAKTSEFWANRWRVMGLGLLGIQSGAIYSDWREIDSLPDNAELLGSGLDFGFTNDPSALVSVYRYNGEIILDEKLYQKGLLNSQLAALIKSTDAKNSVIYADSAEPKSIAELKFYGLQVLPVMKGKDSINYGIQLIQEQPFRVTSRSINLIKELQNYVWMKDKDGNQLSVPIDTYNHCFVGDTLITTDNGDVKIKDIKIGDKAFTSGGYRSIIIKHNNGKQRVNKYRIHFDTGYTDIVCTNNHKFKTTKGWKPIKELTKGNVLYQHKNLITKPTTCTKVKDTSVKDVKDYIELCMNTFLVKYLKGFTFTISTKLQQITELKTLNLLKQVNTCNYTQKINSKTIQNGLNYFTQKESKLQKNGTNQMMELNGTSNTQSIVDLENIHTDKSNVKFVQQNIQQIQMDKDFVQTIVKADTEEKVELITSQELVPNVEMNSLQTSIQKSHIVEKVVVQKIEILGSWMKEVYDITVEDKHEYFANNILVHNCMDATRYLFLMKFSKRSTHFNLKWKR